jgi:hypothetical protein
MFSTEDKESRISLSFERQVKFIGLAHGEVLEKSY